MGKNERLGTQVSTGRKKDPFRKGGKTTRTDQIAILTSEDTEEFIKVEKAIHMGKLRRGRRNKNLEVGACTKKKESKPLKKKHLSEQPSKRGIKGDGGRTRSDAMLKARSKCWQKTKSLTLNINDRRRGKWVVGGGWGGGGVGGK